MINEKNEVIYASATHEAGHAVAACAMGGGMQSRGIILLGPRQGRTYIRFPKIHHGAEIVVGFAGPVAGFRVNDGFAHIGGDVEQIVLSLRELLPRKSALLAGCDYEKYWNEFWALVQVLAITPQREKALAALDVLKGRAAIDIKIIQMLVRFAKQAHEIIDRHWCVVKEIANQLVKNGRLSGDEVEEIVSSDPIIARQVLHPRSTRPEQADRTEGGRFQTPFPWLKDKDVNRVLLLTLTLHPLIPRVRVSAVGHSKSCVSAPCFLTRLIGFRSPSLTPGWVGTIETHDGRDTNVYPQGTGDHLPIERKEP